LKFQIGSLRLIPSSGGVFEVSLNGRSVYSKKATGQFPDPEALLREVQRALK
jgi:selenoprotein W-related protein